MKCKFCGCADSKVLDSRAVNDDTATRRRRECRECGRRFTTYEMMQEMPLVVVKSNGNKELFDASKLKVGIIKACEKRPVSMQKIDKLVDDITKQLQNNLEQETSSRTIGEMVIQELKTLDEVAYVRYASVYRKFEDISHFVDEITKLKDSNK